MASTKTTLKTVRITNEAVKYYQNKPLNRMVEGLMELLKSGKVSFDGEGLKVNPEGEGVNPEIKSILDDLTEISLCCGIEVRDLADQFCEMLNDGTLKIENKELKIG